MGYWRVIWQIDLLQVQAIDTVNRVIEMMPNASHQGGIGSAFSRPKGNLAEPYWVVNLLEELTQPNQWCMDFNRNKLYYLMGQAGGYAEWERGGGGLYGAGGIGIGKQHHFSRVDV